MKQAYYAGKIKVVGANLQCFPVDAKTLDPLSCGSYDPWAWSDPDPDPIETIDVSEWNTRRNLKRDREMGGRR